MLDCPAPRAFAVGRQAPPDKAPGSLAVSETRAPMRRAFNSRFYESANCFVSRRPNCLAGPQVVGRVGLRQVIP